jgi:hypothetical protein
VDGAFAVGLGFDLSPGGTEAEVSGGWCAGWDGKVAVYLETKFGWEVKEGHGVWCSVEVG